VFLTLASRFSAVACVLTRLRAAPAQRAFDVGARFAFSLAHAQPDSLVVGPQDALGWGPFHYAAARAAAER